MAALAESDDRPHGAERLRRRGGQSAPTSYGAPGMVKRASHQPALDGERYGVLRQSVERLHLDQLQRSQDAAGGASLGRPDDGHLDGGVLLAGRQRAGEVRIRPLHPGGGVRAQGERQLREAGQGL